MSKDTDQLRKGFGSGAGTKAQIFAYHCALNRAANEIDRLRAAIQRTLDENSHVADGDNCTLLALKQALAEGLW